MAKEIIEIENLDETKPKKTKKVKKKTTTKKKDQEKSNTKKKKVSSKSKKENVITGDITKIYAPKKSGPSTVSEELLKVTNVMSKEQVKRPKKFAFMTCFYVALALAIGVLCFIRFSNVEKVVVNETLKVVETTKTYIPKIEPIEIDEELLLENDIMSETEKKTTKAQVKETTKAQVKETTKAQIKETTKAQIKETTKAQVKETTKAAPKETEKPKETMSAALLSKAQNKKNEQASNINLPMLNRLLPKYDTELYSQATYYQYNADDINEAFAQLTAYYKSAEKKIWGDVSLDEKGINGKLYLNYTYMKKFIDNITDLDRSKYATLVDVQTTDEAVSFDFASAKDMGMYYEVPASDGKNRLNLMILKGARIGFSQSFSLMTTLEILDLEWGTRHNPYFAIEDVVGTIPRAKSILTETSFRIDEMLKTAKFTRIRYDKKGYITDLFHFQQS